MVRANYNDIKNGIHETTEYLELFLRNFLLGENNELHNRSMHISGTVNNLKKADIRIKDIYGECLADMTEKTVSHVQKLFNACGYQKIFGRSGVENITGLKSSRASVFFKILVEKRVIEPVSGHGKGKYKFVKNSAL